jgi:sigma-B regulation protein RsbU (phosphoserine phosphatase)
VDFHGEFLKSHGLPLGALDDARYSDAVALVPRGGLLLFYTDGITEARSGDAFFGELGLRAAVERLAGWHVEILPALLLEEALPFARGRLHGDAAILAVKYVGKPEL